MLERYVQGHDFTSHEEFRERFRIRVPETFNFAYDCVDEWASEDPGRTALVWCDEQGNEAAFSFAELKRWSDKAAAWFASQGIRKGDPVMLILKRRYQFWFCVLGLHRIGAVAIPATHLLRTKDIVYRNNAAGVRMIVAVDDLDLAACVEEAERDSPTLAAKAMLGSSREGWLDLAAGLDAAPTEFPRPEGNDAPTPGDPMLLYFTSGTTGMPKMVAHDQTYPLGHILTASCWQNVQDGGLHLTIADTGWAKAAWGKLYGQWLAGCSVFVYDYDKFVPKAMLGVISRYKVTSFCAPPTIFRYLIKEDLAKFDLSSLRYCVVAGEPLNPEVYHQWLRATGLRLMEGYGQTEMVLVIGTFPWMEPKPGSMGKPSAGWEIDLLDEQGNPCEPGEEGQIVVRTGAGRPVGMFLGYHRDEELTAKVWRDGVYYTGDMAWRDEDGYYWFVGRADDVIKSSGYRIGPFEVESALLTHPAVLECAVTAVPDPDRGQIVKATVVLARGTQPSPELAIELQEHVKKVTAPYKYPRIVEFATELPKTISGKIRRVEIRDRDR